MPWRRLAIASLAILTMFALGIPYALAAAPEAIDDSATTNENTAVTVTVLANDTDPEGNALTISATTNPTYGSIVVNNSTTITYTPNLNYNGPDSFTYTISDGTGFTDTATVNITVNGVNDAPVAVDDPATTDEDNSVIVSVLANDTDPEDNALTISATTNPTYGSIVVNSSTTITYTPNLNYNGPDTFTYTVSDGSATSDPATVTIAITAVNDAPVAEDDAFTTDEDTQLHGNVTADNGSGADSDVEGTLSPNALVVENVTNGTLTLNTDGSFIYIPTADGTDSFTYTVSDGSATSDPATVTITINSVLDPSPSDPEPTTFDDLEGLSDEAVAAIETLIDLGITTGTDDTSFSPAAITERWQMALFLTRVLSATGTTLPAAESSFSDLAGYSTDAQLAMNQLAILEISTGTSPDEFSPSGAVTRWQMALFLVRTLEAGGVTLPSAGDGTFTDLAGHPDEVQAAVDVLVTLGITTGTTESTFSPDTELPRWQMALFLARVIDVIQG